MRELPQSDLDWLALRLSIATFEINRDLRMGATSKLRSSLAGYVGADNLKVRFGYGKQFITMDSKTVEVSSTASSADIARALNLKKIDDYAKGPPMSVTGYQPGAIQAQLAALKQKAKADRDAAMAKLGEASTKLESVNAEITKIADQASKEADDALQEFAQFTNGAPE